MSTPISISTIEIRLRSILDATSEILEREFYLLPPALIPFSYINSLDNATKSIAYKCCILAWEVSDHKEIPRENQLEAVLSMYASDRDLLIIAGTGSGKTLIGVLLMLLLMGSPSVCITISPLKRLQVSQADLFNVKYGIRTESINEDTPRTDDFWHTRIFNPLQRKLGSSGHLIVTPEQFFTQDTGHLPRMGQYIRQYAYRQHVKYVFIDEIHTAHYAGTSRYGLPAFRKCWGRLSEIKSLFPSTVPWMGLTATCPKHVQQSLDRLSILRPGYTTQRISVNRPNTIYATHQVVGSLGDAQNYQCFLDPINPASQPRVLIFFDNKKLCRRIAKALTASLPPDLQKKNIIMTYHGGLSPEHLRLAHKAFTEPDGCCRILCATSGESTGVDFRDVVIVCNSGLPSDVSDSTQRGGRVIRVFDGTGLYIIFYESWVLDPAEINMDDFDNLFGEDPDRPRTELTIKSSKRQRAGYAIVKLIRFKEICIRVFLRDYHGDISTTALDYNGDFCCDRHNDGFNLQSLLPGALYTTTPIAVATNKPKRQRAKNRPREVQSMLESRLFDWRRETWLADPLKSVSPECDILTDRQIKQLSKPLPSALPSVASLTEHLSQLPEWEETWGQSLFDLFQAFNSLAQSLKRPRKAPQRRMRSDTVTSMESLSSSSVVSVSPTSTPKRRKGNSGTKTLTIRIPPLRYLTNSLLMNIPSTSQ